MKHVQLINCDWLQFHGHHSELHIGVTDKGTNYVLKDVCHGTRVFSKVYEVWEKSSVTLSHRKERLAVVAFSPYSSVLDANMFVCKIENKVLYQSHALARVIRMCKQLNLTYDGITRCDLCVDFMRFANDWDALKLLREYRKNKVIKCGSRKYSQWLTAPFSPSHVNGTVTHDVLSAEHVTHCVSWGGSNSDVHVKMYNKSKEIREGSNKQYIKAWWKSNGLIPTSDVWRVEISFQRRSRYLFDNSCGMTVPVTLEWCLTPTFQCEVFMALARRHFSFKEPVLGKSMRSAISLVLFNLEDCRVMEASAPESKPIAGRTAKVCANYIDSVLRDTDLGSILPNPDYDRYVLEAAHKTLTELYSGLRMLTTVRSTDERPSKKELQEKRDWLAAWNVFPDVVDGVKWCDIDKMMTNAECRYKMLEDLKLHQAELRAHMLQLSVSEAW